MQLESQKTECQNLKQQISECDSNISDVAAMIDSIPAEVINVHRVREELRSPESQKVSLPDWVAKEVTGVKSFYNSQLSKLTDSEVNDLIRLY